MMYGDAQVTIEVGVKLVWCPHYGYSGTAKQVVEVIKVHNDNSFLVEGAGLKKPHNRFTGHKWDYGTDVGKIVDSSFRGYGQTPGSCRTFRVGETQEQFDADFARAEEERKAQADERQAAIDAKYAESWDANKHLVEQTKAPLDFDDMHTVEMVDKRGTRMRVIYKVLPKRIHLWSPEFKEVDGVELRATTYGASTMSGSWRRDDVEDVTEAAALLDLAYKLW
jgi:hypothetical protein